MTTMSVRTDRNSAITEPHVDKRAKSVYCPELNKTWESGVDCAMEMNVDPVRIYYVCSTENKFYKKLGYHFCYEENVAEYRDMMCGHVAKANKNYDELKAENERLIAELERVKKGADKDHEKAVLWDAQEAEREEERKLAESLQQAIADAQKTLARRKRIYEEAENVCAKAKNRVTEAEAKLDKVSNMSVAEWKQSIIAKKKEKAEYVRNLRAKQRNNNAN